MSVGSLWLQQNTVTATTQLIQWGQKWKQDKILKQTSLQLTTNRNTIQSQIPTPCDKRINRTERTIYWEQLDITKMANLPSPKPLARMTPHYARWRRVRMRGCLFAYSSQHMHVDMFSYACSTYCQAEFYQIRPLYPSTHIVSIYRHRVRELGSHIYPLPFSISNWLILKSENTVMANVNDSSQIIYNV